MSGRTALLVVDVQNDFCPGGSLAVPDGDRVVSVINQYIAHPPEIAGRWDIIFASRDWHPPGSEHFQPVGPWPVHCVQMTRGAEFHPALKLPNGTLIISKGVASSGSSAEVDGYSAAEGMIDLVSWDARLIPTTRFAFQYVISSPSANITRWFVAGLATDYCVKATVLDLCRTGRGGVYVISEGCRGVDIHPGDSKKALLEMQRAGAKILQNDTVTVLSE